MIYKNANKKKKNFKQKLFIRSSKSIYIILYATLFYELIYIVIIWLLITKRTNQDSIIKLLTNF